MRHFLKRLRGLPWLLRTACVACLGVGILVPIFACVPFGEIEVFGESLTARELWSRGFGPFLVIAGIAMLIAAVGLVQGRGWARWILVCFYALAVPLAVIDCLRHPENLGLALFNIPVVGGIWGAFFYWYLFRKHRDLFKSPRDE